MDFQKPSVGRIAHYVSYGTPGGEFTSECRAAVITAVKNDTTVDLFVMNPTGVFLNHDCYYTGEGGGADNSAGPGNWPGGSWHWPERV